MITAVFINHINQNQCTDVVTYSCND